MESYLDQRFGADILFIQVESLPTLEQIIEQNTPEEAARELASNVAMLPLEFIEPMHRQPREYFDETALLELSESIKIHGIIQPITVRRIHAKLYQIISGERRFRASKLAGLTEVPAYIRLADDQQMVEMALVASCNSMMILGCVAV